MTKISADIERDYAQASAAGRRAIEEKLQRYIDRGLWAQGVMRSLETIQALADSDSDGGGGTQEPGGAKSST